MVRSIEIGPAGRELKGEAAARYHRGFACQGLPRVFHADEAAPAMNARASLSLLFALFCAAMLGLAAGALWMLPTLMLQRPLPMLAPLVGAVLGLAVRGSVRRGAAAMAAGATLLAAVYVGLLTAAVRIASMLGIGLVDALRVAGLGLLGQLARMALTRPDLVWAVLGAAVAALVALRPVRR